MVMSGFTASDAEQALVAKIFQVADAREGILRGDVAVKLFGGANLPPTVLREVWNIADDENNGWLSRKGVAMALRLMGWVQRGEQVSPALLQKPGPLPTIDGITVSALPTGLPPLSPQDKSKFNNLFLKAGPDNGFLTAEKARDVFLRSKLSTDQLSQIWNLADSRNRGFLDSVDFAIAMYFIQATMSGQISVIPTTLPPGLYQQAGGSATPSVRSHATGTSGSFSPVHSAFPQNRPVQPQYTGQSHLQPQVTGSAFTAKAPPPVPARPSPSQIGSGAFGLNAPLPWDVTPTVKASADRFFDDLDTSHKGYIEGEVAVPFMLQSKLPSDILAQIWDLTDMSGDGRLNRDCFAVAVYLIQQKLAGVDIPATLPPSLIPPSMRNRLANGTSPFSPPGAQSQPPPPPEPARDLFSWDDDTPPPSASAAPPPAPFNIPQQHTGSIFATPPPPARPADPFGSSTITPVSIAAAKDLLSDDEDETSSRVLHDQSAEIGNVQNQLNSTNRSLETAKTEKATVEQTLANQAAQLSALQTQLSSAKVAYETETKLLTTLKDRQSSQAAEIQKTREELITAESDLSAIRAEKAEIEGAFLRDKEETRDLQRRMIEAGQQIDHLKQDVEKAKKEAKQQKGLLAIARKQLATKEAEKAKVEKEITEAQAEATSVAKEKDEVDAALEQLNVVPQSPEAIKPERAFSSDSLTFAASQALPSSPEPATPSVTSVKSNNPFERLTGASTPRPQSPLLPFAGTPVQSPPIPSTLTAETTSDDPFSLSQPAEVVESAPKNEPLATVKSPLEDIPSANIPVPPASSSVLSPDESDFFATPDASPTTASPANEKQSTIDGVIAKFPAVDAPSEQDAKMPGHFAQESVRDTDLDSQLKELDVDESDSDSDEDEVPLSEIKAKVVEQAKSAEVNGTVGTSTNTFDDIFGTTSTSGNVSALAPTSSAEVAVAPSEPAVDAFGVPEVQSTAVAGVNAFDEAMGKISTTTSPAPFTFSFEDTFDFGTAPAATTSAPAATTSAGAPAANGHATSPEPAQDKANTFDSLFNTELTSPVNGQASKPVAPALTTANASFDEAFASFDSGPSLSLDIDNAPAPDTVNKAPESPKLFPTTGGTPTSSPRSNRPSSPPPRSKSPPRVGSPKPTKSSSKDGHEKHKEPPPPRHSKLSIRLPFGKKKKPQEPVPPPASLLTPPQEEPDSTRSPAAEEDAEGVKQLTAMGFSRGQAVGALEKYGYDVPRALNSLLGAQ